MKRLFFCTPSGLCYNPAPMFSLDSTVIDQSSPIPAERRLWSAVLRQAVCDLRYHRSTLQHFTRLWFESDRREPGSFQWICELLEFDASWLRRRLLEMADKKIVRAEMRMADEIDKGQKNGHVAKAGERSNVRASDISGFDSLGIDRRRVAEWREMRDAGEGVVEGALGEALSEGQKLTGEPESAFLVTALSIPRQASGLHAAQELFDTTD